MDVQLAHARNQAEAPAKQDTDLQELNHYIKKYFTSGLRTSLGVDLVFVSCAKVFVEE